MLQLPKQAAEHQVNACSCNDFPFSKVFLSNGIARTCVVNDIIVEQAGHMNHLCDLSYPLLPSAFL